MAPHKYSFKKPLSAWEHIIAHKLGYEWKNIYRLLVQLDRKATNRIELHVFDTICQQYRVHLSNEELGKVKRNYCDAEGSDLLTALNGGNASTKHADLDDEAADKTSHVLRYYEFSVSLQLHKESYNLMRSHVLYGLPKQGKVSLFT